MNFDPNPFLNLEAVLYTEPDFVPDTLPVSFRDIDLLPPMNMDLPCADPCPKCGAFRMCAGDYVCCGMCDICCI